MQPVDEIVHHVHLLTGNVMEADGQIRAAVIPVEWFVERVVVVPKVGVICWVGGQVEHGFQREEAFSSQEIAGIAGSYVDTFHASS